ncbi:MAG: hemolysin III family protein [Congregibacter sp.]
MYYGERLNSISHLVGASLALVGFGALLTVAIPKQDPWVISSFTIYGVTLILLYTMSTLYHSFRPVALKQLFQIFDHVAIYLLIAGTYTPFTLVSLRDSSGPYILAMVWALAIAGILSEVFLSGRAVKIGQVVVYLGMGWACAYDLEGLRANLPENGFRFLAAGGLAYTFGVLFYVLDKLSVLTHAHGIWHMFVLAGSVLHFTAVLGFVR